MLPFVTTSVNYDYILGIISGSLLLFNKFTSLNADSRSYAFCYLVIVTAAVEQSIINVVCDCRT